MHALSIVLTNYRLSGVNVACRFWSKMQKTPGILIPGSKLALFLFVNELLKIKALLYLLKIVARNFTLEKLTLRFFLLRFLCLVKFDLL